MDAIRIPTAGRLIAGVLGCVAIASIAVAQPREKVTIAIGTNVLDASQANNTSIPLYTKCWENEGLAA